MTLLVGLGNPGDKYQGTRHNIGFEVLDCLARQHGAAPWQSRFQGLCAGLTLAGKQVRALKPQTYMNRSGESVAKMAAFFKLTPSEIVVVHDELDLRLGQLRLKRGGGDAGHNGLRSVTSSLKTSEYCRLRIGIGRPSPDFSGTIADYVLQGFASEELPLLPQVISQGAEALSIFVSQGLAQAMNQVNRRVKPTQ